MEPAQRLLFWLLEGTKGGPTRTRLLGLLAKRPMNTRQLALAARLDYKTVEHHVQLLAKNSVLEASGAGYGKVFFVSDAILSQDGVADMLKGGMDGRKKKK